MGVEGERIVGVEGERIVGVGVGGKMGKRGNSKDWREREGMEARTGSSQGE
ncbi:MAG: hypothetical protein M1399_05545 [Actinobacteria bacterium]|nr:hypothetical protein [Actinomycetota bacterium]